MATATWKLACQMACIATLVFTGCTGDRGPQGADGPPGTQGPDGSDGANGNDGNDGANGDDGADGADGADGVTAIALRLLGRYESGIFDQGASEIVSYDPATTQLFQVNANSGALDVLSLVDPAAPTLLSSIDVAAAIADNTDITTVLGAVNSVDVRGGVVAAVIAADSGDERGAIAFFRAADHAFLAGYELGFGPDSLAFSPDGDTVIVANEGEPLDDYTVDPPGSVSVIDLSVGVAAATIRDLDFTAFDAGGTRAGELDPAVRIFGIKQPGDVPSTVSEDIEPEYVAFAPDGATAFVSLQENNAIAVIEVAAPRIARIFPAGATDHGRIGNELDPSDRDRGIEIRNWPVSGLRLPDSIATYDYQGRTLLVTANEGDTRDYGGFSEEERIRDLVLDPEAFPDAAALQSDAQIGRLLTTSSAGDDDGDGDFDRLFAIGSRSFSIYTADGAPIFDSGNQFELITAFRLEDHFNASNDDNEGDSRSDAKGCEPEALTVGRVRNAMFAFIGLERTGGIMVYNISNPHSPRFVQYVNDRNFAEEPSLGDTDGDGVEESNPAAGDLGPESIRFIPAADSPNGSALLIVGNEVSGTTTVYAIDIVPE
ncbi:collagen-like triple helix repeat-containing protein [Haliangium ochraceum]|uniref:Collagen triple helix repeat protein n=1 Tax=Haliangium ochraceum (strain DSM 14365 / JCM 11303 / SMP-2) TaxID=502025 RepID=D0LTD5_HALO1|nr:collagen-like triple helix repeat-containing protein [Haliangium ochraceum]ACY13830.1 Collagen triple helix repeat protein [Haliangium ochraceum DSM 14365]